MHAESADPGLVVVDTEDGAALRTRINALAGTGFDISHEPPLRVGLFRVAASSDAAVHVVVLVVHHISADGASMAPLATDLVAAYSERAAGADTTRVPLTVQYADFALWHREVLGRENDPNSLAARQIRYWTETLADAPDVLELPADRPRPAVQSMHSADVEFAIEAELHGALVEFAAAQQVSLFMVVHAALAVLLARLGGTDDVVVGTPVAGRGEAALDELVGMFVNTLALRTAVDPGLGFAEFLKAVRAADLDAFANADVSFERLVQALNPARSTAHHPLFQVSLSLQNFVEPVLELPGLRLEVQDFDRRASQFDLTLDLRERFDASGPAGLDGVLTYATDLFDEATVASFVTRWRRILAAVPARPDVRLADIELLDDQERAQLIPVRGFDSVAPATLPALLAATVARYPQRPAVVAGGDTTTYRELDAHANRLARLLLEAGAGPETVVALGLPRSPDLLTGMWAAAKIGAAFLPVDPKHPIERIDHMLTDSGARVGLTLRAYRNLLPDSTDWLVLDDLEVVQRWSAANARAVRDHELPRPIRLDNPAWLIYTSGSTGTPKGVSVTHRGIADFVAAQGDLLDLDEESRVLHVASPSFDASILEALMAFGWGGASVVSPAEVFGGSALAELIDAEHVTHVMITPSALATIDPAGVPEVRVLAVGGEAVGAELVERWCGHRRGLRMVNLYGPTEFTVVATGAVVRVGAPVSLGPPIRGAAAMVLDARLRPVPIGVAGELYLAGPALARGYHARPSLTAGRFVTNPYGAPGERMYRTGDLVRWTTADTRTPDGGPMLEYLGRTDFQVKVRGQRIELGEIDAVLGRADGVDFALTLGVAGPAGTTVLAAYLVRKPGVELDLAQIREFAAEALPGYMVPSAFVVLDEIPLTAVGKLDRKALPAPQFSAAETEYRAPRTATEEALAQIVAGLLGLDRVGIDASFFELGGDSILAIQLVSQAKQRGIDCTPLQVFEHRTVAALATAVDGAGAVAPLAELPGGGVGDLPLPPTTRYLLEQDSGFLRAARIVTLELPIGIQHAQLVTTLAAVIDRHDMLRARLRREGGDWRLQVGEPGSVEVGALVRRVEFDAAADSVDLREYVLAELDSPTNRLDPANGVVLRCLWLDPVGDASARTSAGRLLVLASRLLIDEDSWEILLPDLMAAWAQVRVGNTAVLAETGTSMRRWAHALVDEAHSATRVFELGYWQGVLAGADPLIGSRALDPAVDRTRRLRTVRCETSAEVTTTVCADLPRLFATETEHVLLTALTVALLRWRAARSGEAATDTLLRLAGRGRQSDAIPGASLSRTIGSLAGHYPVRLELGQLDLDTAFAGGPALGTAIRAVKQQLKAVPDNGIGFGLLSYLNTETGAQLRAAKGAPGQIGFRYRGAESPSDVPPGLDGLGWTRTDEFGELSAAADADLPVLSVLEVNTVVVDGKLRADFTFPQTLLHRAEIAGLAGLWLDALAAAAEFARTPAAQLAAAEEAAAAAAARPAPDFALGLDVVLPIRRGGTEPALFCIHPSSGISWSYLGFAQVLRPGRPIYALQAPDLSGREPSLRSIEEFADRYVREIRALQPSGPYHLLGWSFGGVIAHAVAARLQADGHRVGLVALLDSDTADVDGSDVEQLTAGAFVNSFGAIFGIHDVPAEATASEAAERIRARLGGLTLVDADMIERLTESYNAAARSRAGYQRPVFDGDLLYFSATVDSSDIVGPDGWRPYATGSVVNHDIEVTHNELTAPHVLPIIARVLDEHLEGQQ